MAEMCKAITLKVNVPPPITLAVNFKGEFLSSSDGEDYKRGYEEGHAQGLIDGQADGYESGYKEGHKVGSETGYQTGKNEGLTEGYGNGYAQGNAVGYKAGYDEGYQKGYSEGYEQGKVDGTKEEQEKSITITENGTQVITPDDNKVLSKVTVEVDVESGGGDSFYDTFWDAIQQNGERTNFNNAFSSPEFTAKTFIPKYDMYVSNGSGMFSHAGDIDLIKAFEDSGKIFDTSNVTSNTALWSICQNSNITTFPVLNCMNISIYLQTCFTNCPNLKRIKKIILPPVEKQIINVTKTFFYLCFSKLPALEQISFDGTICGNISMASSKKLTVESAINILTHLVNYSGTENEFAYSVTFHGDVWTRLDALGNDSPNGNTWREYVNDLGRNAS